MTEKKANIFIKLTAAALVIVCLIAILRLQFQFSELNEQKKNLEIQLNDYQEDVEELKAEIERPFDDEYVIRVAREKLGYHLPDEIIYYNDLS